MWIGVSGPNILAKVNGVIILNAVDTELTGGQVGIGGTNTSIGATTGRNWSGGGFGSASAAPVGYDLYHTPASFAYYGPLAYNKSRQTIQITTNASGKAGIASQHVGVQPGENISASTQGAVISGTGSASLSLLFEDSSGNVIQTNTVSTVAHPSNGGLTTLSLAVAAPTGAAYAQSTIYASTANMVVVFGQHSVDKYNNAYGASTCPSCNVNHSVNLSAKFPPMPTAPSGQTSDPMWSITYNLGNRSSILCTGLGDFWGHPWDSITFEVELAFTVSQDVGPWPNGRRVLASPATCVAYPPDYNPTNAITDQPPPNYWWQTGIAIRPGIYGWKTAWLSTPGVSLPYPFTLPYRCTNKDAGIYSPIQYPWPI